MYICSYQNAQVLPGSLGQAFHPFFIQTNIFAPPPILHCLFNNDGDYPEGQRPSRLLLWWHSLKYNLVILESEHIYLTLPSNPYPPCPPAKLTQGLSFYPDCHLVMLIQSSFHNIPFVIWLHLHCCLAYISSDALIFGTLLDSLMISCYLFIGALINSSLVP